MSDLPHFEIRLNSIATSAQIRQGVDRAFANEGKQCFYMRYASVLVGTSIYYK